MRQGGGEAASPAGKRQEPVLKPAGQRAERSGPQLNGGQLDRERDAVKPPAQPDDVAAVRL